MHHESITRSSSSRLNGAASNLQSDMRSLVKDAQTLLQAAAALSGEKADEVRGKGMHMLDMALGKAHDLQDQAVGRTRELAAASNTYVRDNPWKTAAAVGGIALLLGVILGRKKYE